MNKNTYLENPQDRKITNLIITKNNGKKFLFKVDTLYLDKIQCFQWFATERGYLKTTVKGKHFGIAEMLFGKREKNYIFDHIDRDRSNNLASNFRYVSWSTNINNKIKKTRGKSGIYGIFYCDGMWRTRTPEGKMIWTDNLSVAIYQRARFLHNRGLTIDEAYNQMRIKIPEAAKLKIERFYREAR